MFDNKKTPADWQLHINYIRYQCSHGLPLKTALHNLGYSEDPAGASDKELIERQQREIESLRGGIEIITRELQSLLNNK